MLTNRMAIWFILGILSFASRGQTATVCGVPLKTLDDAIRSRVYWFGKASLGRYLPGSTINADCLIGETLTVIGVKPIVLGRQTFNERSEWIYTQGGFDGTSPNDLQPYFANIEQSIAPIKRSFAETWEENRNTVEDMRSRRIPPQLQPRQTVRAVTERYRLPELSPRTSQSRHTLDMKFIRRAVDLIRVELQKNMAGACPCMISAPYFGPDDPMLFLLIKFRDGQVAVDSYHRDPANGEPRQDDFLYHSDNPAHKFLVLRLKHHAAVTEQVN
jgi:hypothetical protein